jgi:hypothetical protein
MPTRNFKWETVSGVSGGYSSQTVHRLFRSVMEYVKLNQSGVQATVVIELAMIARTM